MHEKEKDENMITIFNKSVNKSEEFDKLEKENHEPNTLSTYL